MLGISDGPRGALSLADHGAVAKVCKHYVNRARFKPRSAQPEFVVILADGCVAAQRSMAEGGYKQRQAAAGFLLQLSALQRTIIDMNMVRVFGVDDAPHAQIAYNARGQAQPIRRVSPTGEYLIAHRMGLLTAYATWVGTGADITIAAQD
ncbi:MAG: hypothetical protein AAF439_05330 [Pseudomonadota bacterium]